MVTHREETATLWQLDFGNESIQIWLIQQFWLIVRHLGFDFFLFPAYKKRRKEVT